MRADQFRGGVQLTGRDPVAQRLFDEPLLREPRSRLPVDTGAELGRGEIFQVIQQKIVKQVVPSVPLPPVVERHQEEVFPFDFGEDLSSVP